ncbi:MAG: type II toxin-antitoxin system Phd/YefM family antitoxin [Panacagrimonas sp.]
MAVTKAYADALMHTTLAGDRHPVREVPATEAKNRFGGVLAEVEAGEVLAIVRHDKPTAVILPVEEYRRMANAASRKLNLLTEEFDALLAGMQTPKAGIAMSAAFHATPVEMGKAAVAAARRKHG